MREQAPHVNIAVRINEPKYKSLCNEDLDKILPLEPEFLRIPCVETVEQISNIDLAISNYENIVSKKNTVKLHLMIENPLGFTNIEGILAISPRIHALCLGGEDWVNNLGIRRTKSSNELDFIRNWINIYASKYNLYAIDSVYPWEEDIKGCAKDSKKSFDAGFSGRALKYISQIPIANQCYSFSKEDFKRYKLIIDNTKQYKVGLQKIYIYNDKIIEPQLYIRALRSLKFTDPNIKAKILEPDYSKA